MKLLIMNLSGNRSARISTKDLGIPQKRKDLTNLILSEMNPHLVLAQECSVMPTNIIDSKDFHVFGNRESCIAENLNFPYKLIKQHTIIELFWSEFTENEKKRMSVVLLTEDKTEELVYEAGNASFEGTTPDNNRFEFSVNQKKQTSDELENREAANASFEDISSNSNINFKKRKLAGSFETNTASINDESNLKKTKHDEKNNIIVISWHGPYQRPDKKGPYTETEKKYMTKQFIEKILKFTEFQGLSFLIGGDYNVDLTTIDFGLNITIYDYNKPNHRKNKYDFLMSSTDIHATTTKIIDINHIISSKYPELQEKSVDCHTVLDHNPLFF